MDKAVKLLVVEDNPADSDLIREYLSEITEFNANLNCVSSLQDAKGFLANNTVHAVLIDLSLPDSRGLDTVREVVEHLNSATAIVLTSLDDRALALAAIESGAQDYVLKGALSADVLARVIRHSIQRGKWMTRLSEIQDQFYRSQKMESIGRLAGGLAHDFNNQLGTILLLSSLARETVPEGHPVREQLKRIDSVTQKSADLVKRLMVFCRQHPNEPSHFDLHEMIEKSRMLFVKLMGATVTVEIKGIPGATIHADPGLIEQAITNLVINARDAMETGGTLTLETGLVLNGTAEPISVCLKVGDTGCGIPAHIRDKVFEPFFTTKEIGKGTGLGLAMVYGTVTQSGGTIALESAAGQGTVFTLTFPYHKAADAAAATAGTEETSLVKAKGETILLVDDDEALRDVTAQLLTLYNFRVLQAANGQQALERIAAAGGKVDLLVTDVVMPKMGGIELSEKIHAQYPGLKVIFTSGYAAEGVDSKLDAKNVTFLPKPFASSLLFNKIREVLQKP